MIITISGTPGSGKSTLAKLLEKKYNATRVYAGALWREWAKERNMSVQELSEYAKTHLELDKQLDETIAKKAREASKADNVVVEGRMQFHFLPESIKILVTVDPKTGAKRIWEQLQKEGNTRNESEVNTFEEFFELTTNRARSDNIRYKELYNKAYDNPNNFDLIIDTTNLTPEQELEQVEAFLKQKSL